MKHWLMDLSREIDSSLRDGSLPMLTLDRIWISGDGHARFLDFRAPGTPETPAIGSATSLSDVQAFLGALATERALRTRQFQGRSQWLATPPDPAPLSERAARHARHSRVRLVTGLDSRDLIGDVPPRQVDSVASNRIGRSLQRGSGLSRV